MQENKFKCQTAHFSLLIREKSTPISTRQEDTLPVICYLNKDVTSKGPSTSKPTSLLCKQSTEQGWLTLKHCNVISTHFLPAKKTQQACRFTRLILISVTGTTARLTDISGKAQAKPVWTFWTTANFSDSFLRKPCHSGPHNVLIEGIYHPLPHQN